MSNITNRREILFLYDVEEGNPNGDPLNEDRPRVDERTGECLVTDDRLKRTVRDYFIDEYDGADERVFVRAVENEDGTLKDRNGLVADELEMDLNDASKDEIREALFKQFLDFRLFGATLSLTGDAQNLSQRGPVQFQIGRSMHSVDTRYFQNSVTLPGGEGDYQGTFADRYNLPYSLIQFYGVVNENAADEVGMTQEDFARLCDGLWNGTKNLITRSKMTHQPRGLITVEYAADEFHIGRLNQYVDFESDKEDESIRSFSDGRLNVSRLREVLDNNRTKIAGINVRTDNGVDLSEDDLFR